MGRAPGAQSWARGGSDGPRGASWAGEAQAGRGGRGRARPGFHSRHPGLTRPPRGPWERACREEERLGGLGQRPPRRGGALTRAAANGRVTCLPGATGKTETKKLGTWALGALPSSRARIRPPVSRLGVLGLPMRQPESKGHSLAPAVEGPTFGDLDCRP